jgi:hypothetical protein
MFGASVGARTSDAKLAECRHCLSLPKAVSPEALGVLRVGFGPLPLMPAGRAPEHERVRVLGFSLLDLANGSLALRADKASPNRRDL